jgi:ATP citrate (pro-S)-lyase
MIISLQCATANPDGQKRALVIGGGIANFTDVAATFSGIIRALKEKVSFIVINLLL